MSVEILIWAAARFCAALGLVFILALLRSRPRHESHLVLAVLVFTTMYDSLITAWVVDKDLPQSVWLHRTIFPATIAVVPLLYLFMSSLMPGFSLKSVSKLHLLPVAVGLLSVPIAGYVHPGAVEGSEVVRSEMHAWAGMLFLISVPYAAMTFKKIREYRRKLADVRSNIAAVKLALIKFSIGALMVMMFLHFLDFLTGPHVPVWAFAPLLSNCFLFPLVYLFIRNSNVLQIQTNPESAVVVDEAEMEKLKNKLIETLAREKPYLNPDLRLKDLADQLGIKSYRLTIVIKKGLGTNFYDLINGLRIEHAKSLLCQRDSRMNLLGVAADSGFNSKSVFNYLFKKSTSLTPSQFRSRLTPN